MELCAGNWGELRGVGELCKGNCVGSGGWCCARELCEYMHTSHQMVWPYTHNCLQYPKHKGDSPLPCHHLPLSPPTAAAR